MNYYEPKQRQSDGRWDYTRNNRPAGYCHQFQEFDQEFIDRFGISESQVEKHNGFANKYHCDGHDSADEACECYKEYQLDHELRLNAQMSNQQQKCRVCQEWTQGFAEIGCQMFVLCDKHNNREEVEKLYKAPSFSMSSW